MLDLGEDFAAATSQAEVSLAKARAGGLAGQIFSIWVDPAAFKAEAAWPRATRLVDVVHEQAAAHATEMDFARRGEDVRRLSARGRFAVLLGLEGAHALGPDGSPVPERLSRLATLATRGLCYLSPTWSNSNDFAGSSNDRGSTRGLSPAGHDLVAACTELGVLIDVSHVSDPTFDDLAAWALSTGRPLVASHSSARALASSPRNLTDAMLRRIAETGGVASVNFCPSFLDDAFRVRASEATATPAARAAEQAALLSDPDPGRAALRAWQARSSFSRAIPAPGIDRVIDHLLHMLSLAGEEHVGLGSDFDGISAVPDGLADVTALPRLADTLATRGVAERVIDKIFATNWLRVLDTR
jgi:membrane dipeptidase